MLSKQITKEELLVVTAARQIKNGDVVVLGIGLPILAGAVAKKTHAPEAVLLMESGIVDFEPHTLPTNVADSTCTRGYGYAVDLFSVFTTITYAGYLDKAFLGVGQIDKFGNINTSYLGLPPEAQRITAAGGAPEFYAYAKETILTMKGKGFVEKLPYLTSPGYLGGGDEREKSGRYTPGSGPSVLITSKGIFRFHPETKEMYLDALFPGVAIDDVRADIPWDLKVGETIHSFPVPTNEEIEFLRRLSPLSSFPNTVALDMSTTYYRRKMEEKMAGR
jgi:glutaconate CoA-transferase, subunit B